MSNFTLPELETLFYYDISRTDISFNYSTYSDLINLTDIELWRHANNFGYKEQRQIFYDCCYNEAFYYNYLNSYRTQVLNIDPYFNWLSYIQSYSLAVNSEYYALLDFIDRRKLDPCINSSSSNTLSISSTKGHYTIIGEQPSYQKDNYLFHYGSGQLSTNTFGMVIPFKSELLRAYFMYYYDQEDETSDLCYNTTSTSIKLDLYIDGTITDYYIEETLDPSHNMICCLFKQTNIVDIGCIINKTTITIEQNSIISWYCSELYSKIDDIYINNPYNPSRNRFVVVLEPL